MCLELALGTRVCAVRVDSAENLMKVVSAELGVTQGRLCALLQRLGLGERACRAAWA